MRKKLLVSLVLLVGLMVAIFYFSSLPNESCTPEAAYGFTIDAVVKHAVLFGMLGFLATNVFWQWRGTKYSLKTLWLVVASGALVAVVYGVMDELHQSLVPTRCCTVEDMAVNAFGGMVGSMMFLVVLFLSEVSHYLKLRSIPKP